jgi:hypothetical protein
MGKNQTKILIEYIGILIRFWLFKILIIVGIAIGAFFIPNQGFAQGKSFVN